MIYLPSHHDKFRAVGKLTALCLTEIEQILEPKITTADINQFVIEFAAKNDLLCAPYQYHGFPEYCCTSVNHVACHGIPSEKKKLKEGDIVSIDVTFKSDKYHADACKTYGIGKISRKNENLLRIAEEVLEVGIKAVSANDHVGRIGFAIENYMKQHPTYSIIEEFVGHGIGFNFHEFPEVSHTCSPGKIESTPKLSVGEIFTIEPIIVAGKRHAKTMKDGWTVVTKDRSHSAQFEHTILITEQGVEVLTR